MSSHHCCPRTSWNRPPWRYLCSSVVRHCLFQWVYTADCRTCTCYISKSGHFISWFLDLLVFWKCGAHKISHNVQRLRKAKGGMVERAVGTPCRAVLNSQKSQPEWSGFGHSCFWATIKSGFPTQRNSGMVGGGKWKCSMISIQLDSKVMKWCYTYSMWTGCT